MFKKVIKIIITTSIIFVVGNRQWRKLGKVVYRNTALASGQGVLKGIEIAYSEPAILLAEIYAWKKRTRTKNDEMESL